MVYHKFGPLGIHEKVYHFSNVKKSKLEMLIFMNLDFVNFRALQCGYNDVPYTWNFLRYVNFTDFVVSRAIVKICSMKILPPRII